MVRSTLALSLLALVGTAGCTGQARQAQSTAQALSVSLCLSLGTGCCDTDGDCPSTATRTEKCDMTSHLCEVTSDTSQCGSGIGGLVGGLLGACDDHDLCTVDACGANGECVHTATVLCCLSDVNCDDGDSCTIDTCTLGLAGKAGQCAHTAVPDPLCCNSNSDCAGGLIGACGVATCQEDLVNPWPVCKAVSNLGVDCCDTVSDCPQQGCNTAACTAGKCVYTPETGAECCALGSDCPVLNACQLGICTNATCGITVSLDLGCCSSASDCGGGDSCRVVSCVANQCVTTETCTAPPSTCTGRECEVRLPDAGSQPAVPTTTPTATTTGGTDSGSSYALRGGGCDMAPTRAPGATAFFMAAALLFIVRRRRA